MSRTYRIERLQELETWASDNQSSEEFPKSSVYVYYCEVCSSVFALRNKLEHPQSILYTAPHQCSTCHFELATSLRCLSLGVRIPRKFLEKNKRPDTPLRSMMPNSSPGLEQFLHSNSAHASVLEVAPQPEGQLLSFGENSLDELCGGVRAQQLTVLYGGRICQTLAEQLCVRSQLPADAGGFDAPGVFIDGGNTFHVYQISNYASTLQLDRDAVLRGIKVSRAFTCYQLVNLIVEKLPELLCKENVKLVVVANLLDMFMDPEIDLRESKDIVNFLSGFLATFAREKEIAIVTACPTNRDARDAFLRRFLTSRAQVVLKAEQTERDTVFALEKHTLGQCASRIIYNDQMKRTSRVKNEKQRQVQYPSCRISIMRG